MSEGRRDLATSQGERCEPSYIRIQNGAGIISTASPDDSDSDEGGKNRIGESAALKTNFELT